jgi:hypothetical protein
LLALLLRDDQDIENSGDDVIDSDKLEKHSKLLQNIPNPFTGTTTIFYTLDKPADVKIKVTDNLGKTVKQFNFSSQQAGENKVELKLNGLTSGIYFYSLYVNGQLSDTKKMVVK